MTLKRLEDEPSGECVERAHLYYDFPWPLLQDVVRTLRD